MADRKEEVPTRPRILKLSTCEVILNFVVTHFWIGPVVTLYWVSTWQLIILVLILPSDTHTSIWISFAIAVGVVSIASCIQVPLNRIANAFGIVWWEVCARLYIYILAFASVNQWRCFWQGWDFYTSTTTCNGLATFFGAFITMALLGCSAKLMASPGTTAIDLPQSTFFAMTTYGNTQPGTLRHVVDSVFTSSFLPFLVATVWRGFWVICDNNLSPDNTTVSATYCLVIAYGLAALLMLTRVQWMKLSVWAENKHWIWKYVVEDAHMLFQTVVAISHWRGVWKLLLAHVLLDVEWRYWLGHALAMVMMSACLASKSLLTTGCDRDGAHPHGTGIDLNMYYVASLHQCWKQMKYNVLNNDSERIASTQITDKAGSSGGGKDEHTPVLCKDNLNEKTTLYVLKE